MKYLLSIFLLASNTSYATPRSVEFWFFSPASRVSNHLMQQFGIGPLYAQTYECTPMGEGCFHPQLGFINEKEANKEYKDEVFIKPTLDTDLIDCDKNNYFDLFCGKARKVEKKGVHVWIDISTSMRRISDGKKGCPQSQFISKLQKLCSGVEVTLFNTRLVSMAAPDDACFYRGLNDRRRLVNDIEELSGDKLIIITDTDEYTEELRTFIDQNLLSTQGLDGAISIGKIDQLASGLFQNCGK